ncbi:MAG: hypothetical protein MUF58_14970 [Arcicella sp.]|nr:hypothetical protein [Arcicella sp.]
MPTAQNQSKNAKELPSQHTTTDQNEQTKKYKQKGEQLTRATVAQLSKYSYKIILLKTKHYLKLI